MQKYFCYVTTFIERVQNLHYRQTRLVEAIQFKSKNINIPEHKQTSQKIRTK